MERCEPTLTDFNDNMTREERIALKELRNNQDIIIKKEDKGNLLVVMSKVFYRDKLVLQDHLNTATYCRTDPSADSNTFKNLKKLMEKHSECLTKKEKDYITKYEWVSSNMYVQPKVHKNKAIIENVTASSSTYVEMDPPDDLKARPIIAGTNSPTQHLSEIIEKILSPLVPSIKSYIKDDWDFIGKLPRGKKIPTACDLHSCDIVSLYTNITHDLGLRALEYWLEKKKELIQPRFTKVFILESVLFILSNNNFYFDGELYHQLIGTAMGTTFAPPYACLSIAYLEETKLYPQVTATFGTEISEWIIGFFTVLWTMDSYPGQEQQI